MKLTGILIIATAAVIYHVIGNAFAAYPDHRNLTIIQNTITVAWMILTFIISILIRYQITSKKFMMQNKYILPEK
jgi:hypothetical protein